MKLYLTNAATVYLAAVMALCSEKGPSQEREEHGKRQIVPAVLKRDKSYLVLIDAYEEIKKLSRAIFNFNRGFAKLKQRRIITKVAKKYLSQGVESIIYKLYNQSK